jgi:4-hydroxy-tetrahydrodipicolinate synthase
MPHALASLRGSLVAIVTPFHHHEQLDEAALVLLCERQIAGGSTAIIACGSTGEAAALTLEEQARCIHAVVVAAAGRVPVIAGCTAPATAQSVALAVQAARAGADGLLCAAPPYVKPGQNGVIAHLRAVSHAAGLPVILYDIPGRVGMAISDETVAELWRRELIIALKDATADLARPTRLRALCGDGLLQFSGDDMTAAAHLAMGGAGCISVTANLLPALCARLHKAWDDGDLALFGALRDRLAPLHRALFAETNPMPVKLALASLGLCDDAPRLPLCRASQATGRMLQALLPALLADEHVATRRGRFALAC